ncbi:DUF3939 domain-containing protein [Neobacillus sp. LXY-4]|uniref:DUF3939 domain-containing protein n=1 Tax=Neobacillus sp. LXY-4 TaxID=3379826 RepID=UPI003EDE8553
MKKTFTKSLGRVTEKLELDIEEKWIYVYYSRGNIKHTAYILRNSNKSIEEYISHFLEDNPISEDLKNEINKFLTSKKSKSETNFHLFTIFLIKTLSFNVVVCILLGISIFAGFKLGSIADSRYDLYPLFTIVGVLLGLIIGGSICYIMIMHYMQQSEKSEKDTHPLLSGRKLQKKPTEESSLNVPIIDVSLDEVRRATQYFFNQHPKETSKTILIKDDFSIDFSQLVHYLGGIPSKKYYMSKETYDVFEESDRHIPEMMDKVQKAVDLYVKDHQHNPTLSYDPLHRVNCFELIQEHYLDSNPEMDFYLTDCDGIISHIKPNTTNKHVD